MYAECAARGATGATTSQALLYVNELRDRANANPILLSEITLDFILR